jgi:LuxR family maltose regulon positive regulatory protein
MREHGHTQPLDTYELLSTKLAPPCPHLSLVSRGPLLARLDEGFEHKLTLLSAPAGFGKTTLVSEWIAAHSERKDLPPVAWVSLDEGDNDPVRFWRYLITACQVLDAAVGESALALLRTSRRLPFETLLTMFINDLAQLAHRGVLVLEDYHIITSPQIHEAVTYLVDHLPATLHLLILTRSDPPLTLARLRAHNDLYELHAADVLSSQPESLQDFLLQTVFLNRLTGSLCDTVTGRNDSERMLEQLERANLFLIPLDDAGQWYRYHALFAEAMQQESRRRLRQDYLRSLYDKASRWYEEHGLLAEAVEVALSAGDFARAAMLIERIAGPRSINRELHTLSRWIAQLPEEVLQSHPALSMAYAVALLFTLDRSDPATSIYIQAPLEMAERYWQAEDNRPKLGEVLALRSQLAWWQGDLSQAFAAARQAFELPLEQETLWSGTVMLAVGMEETLAGKLDAARQVALEARSFFEAVENPYGARAATYILGEVSSRRGDLHEAVRFYRQEFAEAAEDPLDMATALIGLAALSYEWNALQRAEQEVSQALDLGKHHVDEIGKYHAEQVIQVPASLVLARVLHARGETIQAQRLLHEMVVLTQERRWPHLHREVLACQAQISISAGDLAAVQRWSTNTALLGEDFRLVQQEREALIVSRLLIAQGEAGEALRLLERWQAEAHAQGRTRSELEIQVLTALAHFARKHLPMARQTLREALTLAQAEGYQRLLLDEGEAMATLLRAVLLDMRGEALITYVQNLLRAFPQIRVGQGGSPPAVSALLIEPLSGQEQRVLRLLSAGRSNPEIAQELIVSVNTVKTQVQSIYRKLNVKSRLKLL